MAIEPGLPERLMADLGVRGEGGYDPGALPRLAHALRETWRHGDGVALTLDGYRRAGGVDGAVARTAEQVYSELDDAGRDVARDLLLRLVIVSDEGPAVRRRADRGTLDAVDGGAGVLDRLVAARLVTVDGDGARLSHEALLTAWPRLRDWIDLDRAGLVQHRRLARRRRPGGVRCPRRRPVPRRPAGRAARLAGVGGRPGAGCTRSSGTSSRVRTPPTGPGWSSVRRRTRRLRVLVAALSALLLVAVGTVVVATNLRGQAVDARQLSLSRQLAASSDLAVTSDPRRAALLALGAWQAAPTVEARSALLATAADAFRGTMTAHPRGAVSAVAISGDGSVAASGGFDGTLRLWDMRTRREVARLRETGGWNRSVSMSCDGALMLAVDTRNSKAELWDVPNRRVLHDLPEYTIDGAVSPDGRTFAAVIDPGVVIVRDTTTLVERSRFPRRSRNARSSARTAR